MPLDSVHEKPNEFRKIFINFKNVSPQTENNEELKVNALDSVG